MLKRRGLLISIFLLVIVALVGCIKDEVDNKVDSKDRASEEVKLLVSAAASLTDVLNELKDIYEDRTTEVKINYSFGSSGALQTQIEEGAPVDIFMSAAQRQMEALQQGGYMIDETINTLLVNKIVLIVPKDSKLEIESFEDLIDSRVNTIAIGDPSSVPVGQYSKEIFNNLKIMDKLDSKFVLASDVRTALTWIENGEVDCGLVYATDAYIANGIKIVSEAPEGSHKEVGYPVGIVKESKYVNEAQEFLDFLFTDEAKEVFKKYGFTIK